MTMKKELVIYIETNEQDEFVKINRLETDPGFFLLSLGTNRIVINGAEIIEALQTIDHFGTLFDQELKMKQQRAVSPAKAMTITPTTKRGKKVVAEDEGALVLDPVLRLGPTESELALERQTKHMQGETLVITEKK